MLMRYHWGLAVGHVYSHGQGVDAPSTLAAAQDFDDTAENETVLEPCLRDDQDDVSDTEDPELGFDNREDDWVDAEGDSEEEGVGAEEDEDELIVAMDDMYGLAAEEASHYD